MARITGILIHVPTRSVARYSDEFGDDPKKIAFPLECDYIEHVSLGNGDGIWLDEEGKLNGRAQKTGEFYLRGPGGVMRVQGNGLILGDDGWGGLCDARLTLEQVQAAVEWDEPADNTDDGKPRMEFHSFDGKDDFAKFLKGAK